MYKKCKRIFLAGFGIHILLSTSVNSQAINKEPTATQLKLWDDAFLAIFDSAFWGSLIATTIIGIIVGFLGRRFWWAAAPRLRILFVVIFVLLVSVVCVPLGPWIIGLGNFFFSGIDPAYIDWASMRQFGASGILWGLSPGVPAINQLPLMIGLLVASCTLGGLIAYTFNEIGWRQKGVWSKVSGE